MLTGKLLPSPLPPPPVIALCTKCMCAVGIMIKFAVRSGIEPMLSDVELSGWTSEVLWMLWRKENISCIY